MIANIIRWSIGNRPLIFLLSLLLAFWGINALREIPLDAVPDLSDVQVIVKASYPGQSPQVVEDQVTYPLTSVLSGVPGATTVRGYSFFGDSYVYVLFDDNTDPYWARSRVLEYLNQAEKQLPEGVKPNLGPDASGVGWVYEYALVDRSGQHDLAELRTLQDWFLKYELQTLPGVAEVATIGGMVKQYQVIVDPNQLRYNLLPLENVIKAIRNGNGESSASVIEMSEAEYMIRVHGYINSREELLNVGPIGLSTAGTSIFIRDVAEVREGPEPRRGLAELNGEGEVVGGIVVMRWQENALTTIDAVKQRLEELKKSLPDGVEIIETYDRSGLIKSSVNNLQNRLLEEMLMVVLVCFIFLGNLRSSLIIALSLPLGILAAFIVMRWQGINANIMSLGGIAIAIGAMVDAAIVMIENVHKHAEKNPLQQSGRIVAIQQAMIEVGPPLFFSLLIITLSFIPVFALQAQEGRLFSPLAFTKTYAMAAAAGLSITLVPALMVILVKGHIKAEKDSAINRFLIGIYNPLIQSALQHPLKSILLMLVLLGTALWPYAKTGYEFMPELNEGDLLYMPTTFPGISVAKARELLQQTDRLIKTQPEVLRVFGKAGRADTATDPAPLTMLETTIQLKPKDEWRKGMTIEKIKQELDQRVQVPGLVNAWLMPISARIDMLSTGVKTPLGLRISGPDLKTLETLSTQIEARLRKLPGKHSVIAERVESGRYIDVVVDRFNAGQHWFNLKDVQDVLSTAVGGMNLSQTVEGRERYSINLRYPQELRNSVDKLKDLPVVTARGEHLALSELAQIKITDGPALIKSENGLLSNWIYIDLPQSQLASFIQQANAIFKNEIKLPANYSLQWAGQYVYLQRASEKLMSIIPQTLIIILVLLYLSFRNMVEPAIIMLSVPFALIGGFWLIYLMGIQFSVAVAIGFIALAGLAAEFGIIMLVYIRQSVKQAQPQNQQEFKAAVLQGAVQRVRPKAMTVAVIIGGLLPILIQQGTGTELMIPIAAPLIGGMISAPLVSMFLIPVLYVLYYRGRYKAL